MSALKSQADLFVGVNYLDKDAERVNKLIEKLIVEKKRENQNVVKKSVESFVW